MIRWLNLLLLCSVCHGGHCFETIFRSVTGKKGGDVTLKCDFEAREVAYISFNSQSTNIPVCQTEACDGGSDHIFKTGPCDIVIKDLRFSDAGKYFLNVYFYNKEAELERQIKAYQLHVQGELSVRKGSSVELDVLLSSADKVESNSSGEWTEIWSRRNGAQRDRLSHRDGRLVITEFRAGDMGSYVVLDTEGELLISVSITESGSGREQKASPLPVRKRWSLSEKLGVFFAIWGFLWVLTIWMMFLLARNL